MNAESKVDVLTTFVNHRSYILQLLTLNELAIKADDSREDNTESHEYLALLMDSPVSKLSKFSDSLWDYNLNYPNAARNVQGAKLRLDFARYTEIPPYVITELKVVFELVYINPRIFAPQQTGGKARNKGTIKANTLIARFKNGLAFINELFKQTSDELGREYVQSTFESMSDILPGHYQKAASSFDQVKGIDLDKFFSYLRNPAANKYVFEKPIAYVDLNQLAWKKAKKKNKQKKEQVLPDIVFESLSKKASLIIVDFLEANDLNCIDTKTLDRLNNQSHSWAKEARFDSDIFAAYTAIRLRTVGYSHQDVIDVVTPCSWMLNSKNEVTHSTTLRKEMKARGYGMQTLKDYISLVQYSCLYVVGQYTGMRPSELAEIIVTNEKCLIKEDGCWLIQSEVKKHVEEENRGLFDDKWVAIPIVRDAIRAASHIAKMKRSPYLLSNIDTCHPDKEPKPMGSPGVTHQLDKYIGLMLGTEAVEAIDMNPYMMRHTLAYQLFKAEAGLPLISFQLKHFVDEVGKYTSAGTFSQDTLGYGDIGEMVSKDSQRKKSDISLRKKAELEVIKSACDPDAIYYGGKAQEHLERMKKFFDGYMASGYSKEEIYEAMLDQGFAVAYMGQGMCFGGREEEFDESLPCIGSLRCNPARCKQAVVTKQHAPKWREVYFQNKANLNKPEFEDNHAQIQEAMHEAKMVLEYLHEEVEV